MGKIKQYWTTKYNKTWIIYTSLLYFSIVSRKHNILYYSEKLYPQSSIFFSSLRVNPGIQLISKPWYVPGTFLDSKVHVANMGPTWVLLSSGGPHVGPMNLAIRVAPQHSPPHISSCISEVATWRESIHSNVDKPDERPARLALFMFGSTAFSIGQGKQLPPLLKPFMGRPEQITWSSIQNRGCNY